MSLVDKCQVMGTTHLYKQRPFSHFPATVDRRYNRHRHGHVLYLSNLDLLRSGFTTGVILDQVTLALFSETCCEFGTWTGQVHEWWEQHQNDQAIKNTFSFWISRHNLNLYAPCILNIGQAYCHSPANAFYIFSQQVHLMIFLILARTISVFSSRKRHVLLKVTFFGS